MNKLKEEENLRRALSHIERHKQAINTSNNSENDFHKLLLQFSYEVYERIKANKKPYPNLDSDKVF